MTKTGFTEGWRPSGKGVVDRIGNLSRPAFKGIVELFHTVPPRVAT